MPFHLSLLLHDTMALVTILNPIAAASIMISLIGSNATSATIRPIAFKTTLTIIIAGLVTLYSGEYIFKFFGINVMSIKVIGGILLMMIAINMASGNSSKSRHTPKEHEEAQESEDISIIPLGIPILFGPGVIATIVVLNNTAMKTLPMLDSYIVVSISILLSGITSYLILVNASFLNRILGITGMKILTRIMGLVVGAIAAQFIISGVKGLWG
ncbi:multiple antibiotic resistance (MarC)-related protein [hydrothermal vent metagenome]|uniref:Multiple antibiotic resistance (MarC)-related protein n=1 Tax=hydrothermal vent metagenome TaxID=652676 RepID=A0A1W1CXA7_9ZZZZ